MGGKQFACDGEMLERLHRLPGLALDHAESLETHGKLPCGRGIGALIPFRLPIDDQRFQLRLRGVELGQVEGVRRRAGQGGCRCQKDGKMQREAHAGSGWRNSVRVKCKFFHKIWKSLISTAIGVGMTRFTHIAQSHSDQAPGGARMGSATVTGMSSPSETTAREIESVVRKLPKQAGGPAGAHRAFRISRGRSLQNGKTVTCRGAGRSARIPFCDRSIGFIVTGGRMPGGVRASDNLLC